MELIGPLLDIVNNIFWRPISNCVKYHRSLDDNMKILEEKLEALNCRKADIDSQIRVGRIASEKIVKEEVDLWLRNVQGMNDDKHLKQEVEKGKYLSRARLGKLAAKKIQEIDELHQKGSFADGFLVEAPPGERLDDNMKILKEKLEELNSRKADIESQIRVGTASEKLVKEEVQLWLRNVQGINDEYKHLELEVGKGEYLSRALLEKLAAKKIQEIEELHQKGSFVDGVMVEAPPVRGERFQTVTVFGETTAIRKLEEIWTTLMSNKNRKIGVYGMGGSGKTTILKDIHNRVLEKKDNFDTAIWITVSKAIDLIKLQGDIASALGLNIENIGDVAIRAKMLFEKLEQKKRWVIIFDDMWEAFNLEDVGVPEPTVENGCKLILTTRSLDVCRRMNCKCIKMELLSEDEAWNLFLDKVGRDVSLNPDLEAIAKDVAKECACLPLAIITIGRSMNGVVDPSEWRNLLTKLRKFTKKGLNDMEKVIERVKLSYTRLKDEKLQRCLLFCALYPEDYEIPRNEVIIYLIAEEIVEGIGSWQEKCDEGNTILNKLENVCLLESCSTNSVKMHDVIRDMSLQIMGQGSMVKAREKLRDFPDMKEWKEDLETVSLMANVVEEIYLDSSPRCGRLKTLLLADNEGLTKIPDSFFVHMPSLRFLRISATEIQHLPDSFSRLEHLTGLWLEFGRSLKYVPSLAKLQGTLRVLSLRMTAIEELPQGLEMLVNLQCLDFLCCHKPTIQTGILSKLIRLQYLRVSVTSENPKIAEEIASLRKLEALVVHFYYPSDFNTYVRSLRMQQSRLPSSFKLLVGPQFRLEDEFSWNFHEISQPHKFIGMSSSGMSVSMGYDPNVLRLLPKEDDVEEFCIGRNVKLSSLCDILIREGGGGGLPSSYSIPPLQQPMSRNTHFFSSCLRKLHIRNNDHIKKVFTPQLMPLFQNLEVISVFRCRNVREIFSATEEEEEEEIKEEINEESSNNNNNDALLLIPFPISITLPKLRILYLLNLPELKSITSSSSSSRGIMMVCNSIQEISVYKCPKLKRLPLSLPVDDDGRPSPPPSLTKIGISSYNSREWWDSLEWDNPLDKDVLQPFLRFPSKLPL